MKFSYNWLKDLSNTKLSPEKIAEKLTLKSFEVEGVKKIGNNLDKVVVGEILKVDKHPDADNLNIVKVNVGEKDLEIVCGAPNIRAGQKVPVALVGAILGEDFEIKKTEIRGIESNGMLCAEDELGLGDDHEGIMILDNEATIGEDFAKYLSLNDTVLDIDILPNRAHDALSYEGVAREICIISDLQFTANNLQLGDIKKEEDSKLDISVETKKCKRYIGIKIENIKISESPTFVKSRLLASGIKPINNIVDATNYVMLETGQPLHAFEAKAAEKILVRQGRIKEELVLLDDTKIELNEEDIVITDGEKPIALAGIMGGKDSAINNETTSIILESASFDDVSVRLTQRRLNLHTDAGYRFEREIDPNIAEHAIVKAVQLILDIAGGKVSNINDTYEKPVLLWKINLETKKVSSLLGIDIAEKSVLDILKSLGIETHKKNELIICNIPTRRIDLQTQEDLIEEIGRIYGYEKITPIPLSEQIIVPQKNEERYLERSLKNMAIGSGFDEVRGYSFYSINDAEALGLDGKNHITIMNPMSSDQEIIRETLGVGLLKSIKKSSSYFDEINIFDIGKVYTPSKNSLPQEKLIFSLAVASKNQKGDQFFILKGFLDEMLREIGVEDWYIDTSFDENIKSTISQHPSRKAMIKASNGDILGNLGEISKKTYKHFGLKKMRVAIMELDIRMLLEKSSTYTKYVSLPKFPETERDLSMIVGEQTRVADVERLLYSAGKSLVSDIDLFDLYTNPETSERSMAFHIKFSHPKKTLTAKEVDTKILEMIKSLEKELGITVRTNQ